MAHAPRVCNACKSRKKRCDKALPRCGFCTTRDLICSYDLPSCPCDTDSENVRRQNTSAPARTTYSRVAFFAESLSDLRFLSATTVTLDQVLHFHVCRILRLTKLSIPEISERFLRNFYRWLPILSPTQLNRAVTLYEDAKLSLSPPLADFSILILALCLITWHQPGGRNAEPPLFSLESLYTTVRTLFGQVQAARCASLSIVQAGLLIAAYDYARGRPYAAYISMGTCVRMALTLGFDKVGKSDSDNLQDREEYIIWRGIVVLERHILCEIPEQKQPLAVEYARFEAPLPCEAPFTTIHSDATCFGRLAQVSYLLDQILCVIHLPEQGRLIKAIKLIRLDRELQGFLDILTRDTKHEWNFSCGPIGTVFRSLFLLHEHILSQQDNDNDDDDDDDDDDYIERQQWIHQMSHSALATATKMMVDVAHDHLRRITPGSVDGLPLTCLYNLRSAMKHIRMVDSEGEKFSAADMELLVALDIMIVDRWCD